MKRGKSGWFNQRDRHRLSALGIATQFHKMGYIDDISYTLPLSKWIKNIQTDSYMGETAFDFDIVPNKKGKVRNESSSLAYHTDNIFNGALRFPLIPHDDKSTKDEIRRLFDEIQENNYYSGTIKLINVAEGTDFEDYNNPTHYAPHIFIRNKYVKPAELGYELNKITNIIDNVMEVYE